jgi:hypothetical protein
LPRTEWRGRGPGPPPRQPPPTRGRCVSIFLGKNRRCIGKSQPKRPSQRTQRTPHRAQRARPASAVQRRVGVVRAARARRVRRQVLVGEPGAAVSARAGAPRRHVLAQPALPTRGGWVRVVVRLALGARPAFGLVGGAVCPRLAALALCRRIRVVVVLAGGAPVAEYLAALGVGSLRAQLALRSRVAVVVKSAGRTQPAVAGVVAEHARHAYVAGCRGVVIQIRGPLVAVLTLGGALWREAARRALPTLRRWVRVVVEGPRGAAVALAEAHHTWPRRCVSMFLGTNRHYIGKSQSTRPTVNTHHTWLRVVPRLALHAGRGGGVVLVRLPRRALVALDRRVVRERARVAAIAGRGRAGVRVVPAPARNHGYQLSRT